MTREEPHPVCGAAGVVTQGFRLRPADAEEA